MNIYAKEVKIIDLTTARDFPITRDGLDLYISYLNNPECLSRFSKKELIDSLYIEQYLDDPQFFGSCMRVLDRQFTVEDALSILRARDVEIDSQSLLIQTALQYVASHLERINRSPQLLSQFFHIPEAYLVALIRHVSAPNNEYVSPGDPIFTFMILAIKWSQKGGGSMPTFFGNCGFFLLQQMYTLRAHEELINAVIVFLAPYNGSLLNKLTRSLVTFYNTQKIDRAGFIDYANFLMDYGVNPRCALEGTTGTILSYAISFIELKDLRENTKLLQYINFLRRCVQCEGGAEPIQIRRPRFTLGSWYDSLQTIDLDWVEVLASAGVDMSYGIDEWFSRVLQFTNVKALLRILLDRGLDINKRINNGNTLLMEAARLGYTGVVELLLEKGADPALTKQNGRGGRVSALDLAANVAIRDRLSRL